MIHLSTMTDDNHVEFDVLKTKDLVNATFALHFPFGTWGDTKGWNSAQSDGGESGLDHILPQSLHTVLQQRKLKLGMGVRELEKFMTRVRKDKRTGKKVPQVIPIVVHLTSDNDQSNADQWIDGHGNQAGFRPSNSIL